MRPRRYAQVIFEIDDAEVFIRLYPSENRDVPRASSYRILQAKSPEALREKSG